MALTFTHGLEILIWGLGFTNPLQLESWYLYANVF